MRVYCDGIEFDEIAKFKDLASSIEADFVKMEVLVKGLEGLMDGDIAGMEGILTDTIKTGYHAAKGSAKMGKNLYKAANRKVQENKNKWRVYYKPLIMKTIKELGNILQNIYFKFTKLGKRYSELGKKIKFILNHKINQVGRIPGGTKIYLHNFEVYVLKGYVTIMEDYTEFYKSVIDQLAENYKEPKEIVGLIKSKRAHDIEAATTGLSNAIEQTNKYGEITVPWSVFKYNRYYSFFKGIVSNKPSKENLNQSTSDFVKGTILAKEVAYTFDVNDRAKFIDVAKTYLSVLSSILNNNVLEEALNKGGKTVKESTNALFKELDTVGEALNSLGIKREVNENEEENEQDKPEDTEFAGVVEGYIQNTSNLITKTATAYTGIVRGTLSAVFVLVNEAESLIDIINSSAGAEKKAVKEDSGDLNG